MIVLDFLIHVIYFTFLELNSWRVSDCRDPQSLRFLADMCVDFHLPPWACRKIHSLEVPHFRFQFL